MKFKFLVLLLITSLLAPFAAKAQTPADSFLKNGSLAEANDAGDWPKHWARPKVGGSYEKEGNVHFIRLTQTTPDELVMLYQEIRIPDGTKAIEFTWKQRVTDLKVGDSPWFDARIILDLVDANREKVAGSPGAQYSRGTKGWESKRTAFLVPPGARYIKFMPCLFRAKAGTFDLTDFAMRPTDTQELEEAAAKRDAELKAKYVPPEEPNKAKWPKELKVVGNKLIDSDGKEVWLQGVNAGGLETIPQDSQPIKSTVVAIDDWKANCVRVPIKEEFWYGKSPYQKDGGKQYREFIDQIITLAANRGAYVVIDLHRFRAPKQEHADFWKDFAAVYKDHPAVLFDLFNEPHGISWEVWKNGGFVGEKTGTDESAFLTEEEKKKNQGFESIGMQALINAVRSTGAKNIVIAGGLTWCNDLSGIVNGYALEDKTGNGIMYSWHTYNWHGGWAKILPVAEKYPIFLGEVGADIKKMDFIPHAQQEDPYTFIPDMLGFIQKYHINWTGWCFHPRATPVMISDWSYTPTPFWGVFAKEALAGKQFEMKRMR
jgi:aryl-phospho-beta-D-glucosidase BglC (GH1 family)